MPLNPPFALLSPNDPAIEAIANRIRAIVARQSGYPLDVVAELLGVSAQEFRQLVLQREQAIDTAFLIDVIAAFVREFAVDPQWLLTGRYDPAMHRQGLLLGENRTPSGAQQLREFIRVHYQRLRLSSRFFSAPDAPRPEM